MRRSEGRAWFFVAPAFLHLLLFAWLPILWVIYLSLFKVQLLRDEKEFVGFGNYTYAFADPPFWNALWNTLRYTVVSVPLGIAFALVVAILVNQPLRGVTLFRTIFYIPSVASGVAVAMLWIYVYLPETGMINSLIGLVGKTALGASLLAALHLDNTTDFLQNPALAMWAIVFMSLFTGLGPRMVLFLAGLVGIPPELYEAAELDGAGKARSFWKITLPMLSPTMLFVVVTSTIGALQLFTPIYMMTRGGPEETTDVVGYHIYSEAWVQFNTGLASAKSLILFVAVALVAWVQIRMMRNTHGVGA